MKIIQTPAGGSTIYVDVQTVSYSSGNYAATVHVRFEELSLNPGGVVSPATNTIPVPSAAITVDAETTLEEAVCAWLVSPDGPYTGGLIVSDDDFATVSTRHAAKSAVKRKRDEHEFGGITTPFGVFDTDARSQSKINGAVTMALIAASASQPFEMVWRLANDATVTLDGPQMISVGVAVGEHVAACQMRKNDLDAALEVAATVEAIEAIDLDAGWPA